MEEGSLNQPRGSYHQSQRGNEPGTTDSYQADLRHALTIQRDHSGARGQIVELQASAKWVAGRGDTQSTLEAKADGHVTSELGAADGGMPGGDPASVRVGSNHDQKVMRRYQVPEREQLLLAQQLEQQRAEAMVD